MLTACMVQGSESFWVVGNTIRHMIAATPIFLRVESSEILEGGGTDLVEFWADSRVCIFLASPAISSSS